MKKCDYCGRDNDEAAATCHECGTGFHLPVPLSVEAPSELPTLRLINPGDLGRAFDFKDGFHRCDWAVIRDWIDTRLSVAEQAEGWSEAALLWASKLRDDLGGNYALHVSRETILLCDRPLETARWVLDYAGRVTETVKDKLGDLAWAGAFGRDLILIFSDEDDYYQYVAHHSPDREQPASGGVCILSGYTHIALPWRDELDAANAIVHELIHDSLAHLPLPLWLNEGIAVILQKAVAPTPKGLVQSEQDALYGAAINWQAPLMWDELAERHFAFWNPENIQSFWAGTSFHKPGDFNELSYSLAEVIVSLITERANRATLLAFIESARQDDAGQTAAMDILSIDLGEVAGTFLGEGDWRPKRKALTQCWQAAGWQNSTAETASDPKSATESRRTRTSEE